MTRKEHLQAMANHHKAMSRISAVAADGFSAIADATEDTKAAAGHRIVSEAFGAMAGEHTQAAEDCEACYKADGGEDDLEKGFTLQPWPARAVIPSDVPNVRKVLRPGQPDYSEGNPATNLPDIFQKLTVLDENEV